MANKTFNITGKMSLDISNVQSQLTNMQKVLNNLKLPKNMSTQFTDIFSKLNGELSNYQERLNKGFKTKSDVTGLEKSGNAIIHTLRSLDKEWTKLSNLDLSSIITLNPQDAQKVKDIDNQIKTLNQDVARLNTDKLNQFNDAIDRVATKKAKAATPLIQQLVGDGNYSAALTEITTKLRQLNNIKNNAFKGVAPPNMQASITAYEDMEKILNEVIAKQSQMNSTSQGLQADKLNIYANAAATVRTKVGGAGAEIGQMTNEMNRNHQAAVKGASGMAQWNSEIDMVKNQAAYFFGLSNSINLVRRALRSAFETVKELDKAMTETAVVTKMSVSDLWGALPKYTAAANELGTTTLGAYQTMTLYYQQGLKTNEVFEIGTETMKMARIAGMEYTQATDLMTAALRGFNMELNETSAQKVNDVYSKLAAITASNTEEIATAMTKTASIANAANMEFETTAAFLTQMIETTRESAENLGTAMKTIIARFTEMKKDPNGIVEVDGEEVDVNRVDEALRSVGVALKDTTGQFRDLDDVFLELARKWDTLDLMQQRYVATTAAGSRQQSRFIAMMDNYDRTMELVNAANNSAGASNEQFAKTTESLESKLNKLSNAWNEFTMGLANSAVIKTGIDLLTKILDTVNAITGAFGDGVGGVLKFAVAIASIRMGKGLVEKGFGFIGKAMGAANASKEGEQAGVSFLGGLRKSTQKAKTKTSSVKTDIFGAFSNTKQTNEKAKILKNISKQEKELTLATANYQAVQSKGAGLTSRELALEKQVNSQKRKVQEAQKAAAAKRVAYQQAETTANNRMVAANAALNTSYQQLGFSKQELTIIQSSGLSQSQIAILLSNQESAALLRETLANDKLTEAKKREQIAQMAGITQDRLSLAQKIAYYAQMLFGNKVTRQSAAEHLGLAVANTTQAGATGAAAGAQALLNKAMLACPLGWVIAGIGLLAGGIALFVNLTKQMSLEEKLELAGQAAEEAKTAADDAKTAYDDLLSKKEEHDNLQNTLDELTIGTNEWKKALIEANQQVMQLLQTYPELTKYLQKSSHGALSISEEGWNVLLDEQLKRANRAQMAAVAGSQYQSILNNRKKVRDISNGLTFSDRIDDKFYRNFDVANARKTGKKYITGEEYSETWQKYINGEGNTKEEAKKQIEGWIQSARSMAANGEIPEELMTDNIYKNGLFWSPDKKSVEDILLHDDTITPENAAGALNELLKVGKLNSYSAEIEKIAKETKTSGDHVYNTMLNQIEEYQNALEQIEIANTESIKSILSATTDEEILKSPLSENLINGIAGTLGTLEDAIDNEIKALDSASKTELLNEYSELYNIPVEQISETLSDNTDLLKQSIAQAKVGEKYQEYLSKSYDSIQKMSVKSQKQYTKILAKDASVNLSETKNFNEYMAEMGYETQGAIEDYAKSIGTTAEELKNSFEQAKKDIEETQIKNQQVLRGVASISASGNAETLEANLSIVEKLNSEQQVALSNFATTVTSTFGGNITSALFKDIFRGLGEDLNGFYTEFQSTFGQIDWENPILATEALNKSLKSSDPSVRKIGKSFKVLTKDIYGAGEQMQYFLKSEEFTAIQEDIESVLEEGSQITAEKVKEYAQTSTTLQKILKNTNISATALAKTLNDLGENNLNIEDITTGLLELIENTESLNSVIEDSIDLIENFDAGTDEGSIADGVNEIVEKVSELIDMGEYGNTQLYNYLKLFFGEDFVEAAEKDLQNAEETYTKKLQKLYSNLYGAWQDLANQTSTIGEDIGISMLSDGSINLDIGDATTDDLVKAVMEAYSVTEAYAKFMVTDFKNYSADLANELRQNDYAAGWEGFIDESTNVYKSIKDEAGNIEETKSIFLNAKDLQNYATLYGKSEVTVWKDLANYLEIDISKLKSVEEIKQKISDSGKVRLLDLTELETGSEEEIKAISDYISSIWGDGLNQALSNGKLSLDSVWNTLIASGLSDTQITNALEAEIKNWKNSENSTIEFKGVKVPVEDIKKSGLTEALETAQKEADASIYANAFMEAINTIDTSSVGDNITKNIGGALDSAITKAKFLDTLLNGNEHTITYTDTSRGYSQTKSYTINKDNIGNFIGYASGTQNAPKTKDALVGEEGAELSYNPDTKIARILGNDGPEITTVEKGEIIYTAEQTKKILKGKKTPLKLHSFATGYRSDKAQSYDYVTSKAKEEKSKSSEKDVWENSYDKLYNLTEDINENLREREELEREYDKLLKNRKATAVDLYENYKEQLANLEEQKKLQTQMLNSRKQEIKNTVSKNSDLQGYATYNWKDMTVEIDWSKINKVTDPDLGERIENYVSKLEELQDSMDEAKDAISDIEENTEELKEQGHDEMVDFEQKVLDAIIDREEKKIEKLEAIDDSITDGNSKLLDSIQENLDKVRQQRENEEKEKDLAEKEAQLSYLQLDTSGANDLAIAELEKEIAEGQQDYTDTLIDQKLTELQEQNEQASEERQAQIEIMKAQLEKAKEQGDYWKEVYKLISFGTDATGKLIHGSELENILKDEANYSGLSKVQKMDWLKDLEEQAKISIAQYSKENQLEKLGYYANQKVTFTDGSGKTHTGIIQKDGSVKVSGNGGTYTYKDVYRAADGTFKTLENNGEFKKNKKKAAAGTSSENKTKAKDISGSTAEKIAASIWIDGDAAGWGNGDTRKQRINQKYKNGYDKVQDILNKKAWNGDIYKKYYGKDLSDYYYTAFKTGGLADFTGPAWLDGTKSSPELVLNQQDTKNFLILKDVLSSLLNNTSTNKTTANSGDNYFEINIQVDKLESDYDVDDLANKVKKIITDDSRYRNVNTINFLR